MANVKDEVDIIGLKSSNKLYFYLGIALAIIVLLLLFLGMIALGFPRSDIRTQQYLANGILWFSIWIALISPIFIIRIQKKSLDQNQEKLILNLSIGLTFLAIVGAIITFFIPQLVYILAWIISSVIAILVIAGIALTRYRKQ